MSTNDQALRERLRDVTDPGSWVIATTDTRGSVDNLIGPFNTQKEARKYLEENDEYFADLETDLVKADSRLDAETVDSVILYMNAPDEMWKVIS